MFMAELALCGLHSERHPGHRQAPCPDRGLVASHVPVLSIHGSYLSVTEPQKLIVQNFAVNRRNVARLTKQLGIQSRGPSKQLAPRRYTLRGHCGAEIRSELMRICA